MRVSSDLALIRIIDNLRLIIKIVSNLKVLMGLNAEELFECNFMTGKTGNFHGLTKVLNPWIICFKYQMYISLKTIRGDILIFPHFHCPSSQPSQINVNLSDFYGEIMTSAGKLVFSLHSRCRKIFLFKTLPRTPISPKTSRIANCFVWVLLGQMLCYQMVYPKLCLLWSLSVDI